MTQVDHRRMAVKVRFNLDQVDPYHAEVGWSLSLFSLSGSRSHLTRTRRLAISAH